MPYGKKPTDSAKLCDIAAHMASQDNRATSWPLFEIHQKKVIYGVLPEYNHGAYPILLVSDGESEDALRLGDKAVILAYARNALKDFIEDVGVADVSDVRVLCGNDDVSDVVLRSKDFDDLALSLAVEMENGDGNIRICANGSEDDGDATEFRRIHCLDVDEIVTVCFTQDAADAYIAANAHNLNEPYIYVSSAHNNPEMRAIMESLVAGIEFNLLNDGENKKNITARVERSGDAGVCNEVCVTLKAGSEEIGFVMIGLDIEGEPRIGITGDSNPETLSTFVYPLRPADSQVESLSIETPKSV